MVITHGFCLFQPGLLGFRFVWTIRGYSGTPKKGRKKKGDKKPVREMKLTVDIQQWLREENEKQ